MPCVASLHLYFEAAVLQQTIHGFEGEKLYVGDAVMPPASLHESRRQTVDVRSDDDQQPSVAHQAVDLPEEGGGICNMLDEIEEGDDVPAFALAGKTIEGTVEELDAVSFFGFVHQRGGGLDTLGQIAFLPGQIYEETVGRADVQQPFPPEGHFGKCVQDGVEVLGPAIRFLAVLPVVETTVEADEILGLGGRVGVDHPAGKAALESPALAVAVVGDAEV